MLQEIVSPTAVHDFVLEATRTALTDNTISTPQWSWMSSEVLMVIRIINTAVLTGLGGASAIKYGIAGYSFWISDWGLTLSIMTMWVLTASHFITPSTEYEGFAKALFEVTFPLEMLVTIAYWALYYTPGTWVPNDFSTWFYPIFMHVVPMVSLFIDWLFNSVIYDWVHSQFYSLYIVVAYTPLTYFANWIVGWYPYSFVDYSSWMSAVYIVAIWALNMACFYAAAFGTNFMKTGSGISFIKFKEYIPKEFKNLMKIGGI
jgi:hypothetical protein